ncbi:MAG: hypothetical protein AAGD04_03825 [Pseudomonadota bacterium]
MKNPVFCLLALTAPIVLAACDPSLPESGVGFKDYDAFQQERVERERSLTGTVVPQNGVISGEVPSVSIRGTGELQAASPTDPLIGASSNGVVTAGTSTTDAVGPSSAGSEAVGALGISRENDFDAVSGLRDIEADAARRRAQAAQYQQIAPTAVPDRDGSRPNIVQYALNATNNVGEPLFTRRGFNLGEKMIRACARYPSADIAQEDFLANGGPERDKLKVDPDGDGFACAWDPAPFRRALSTPRAASAVQTTPLPQ